MYFSAHKRSSRRENSAEGILCIGPCSLRASPLKGAGEDPAEQQNAGRGWSSAPAAPRDSGGWGRAETVKARAATDCWLKAPAHWDELCSRRKCAPGASTSLNVFNHRVLQNLVWIAFPHPGWDQKICLKSERKVFDLCAGPSLNPTRW